MIIQREFEISNSAYAGIQKGTYYLSGGVVRWTSGEKKGKIVEHLKNVSIPKESKGFFDKVKNLAKNNLKATLIVGGVLLAAVGVGTTITILNKRKTQKAFEIINRQRPALNKYMEAIERGCLTQEIVDATISELEATINELGSKYSKVKLSVYQYLDIIGVFEAYYRSLCNWNGLRVFDHKQQEYTTANVLYECIDFLKGQKEIIGRAS